MPISSSSFFHFIKGGVHDLKLILQNGFRVSFSQEVFSYEHIDTGEIIHLSYNIPMLCFCDIPLSLIDSHAQLYCKNPAVPETKIVGIGMKRNWGLRNGLTPVTYISSSSRNFNFNELDNLVQDMFVQFYKDYENKIGRTMEEQKILDRLREFPLQPTTIVCRHFKSDGTYYDLHAHRKLLYEKLTDAYYYTFNKAVQAPTGVTLPYLDYFEVSSNTHSFYNEREWRYVHPTLQVIHAFQNTFRDDKYRNRITSGGYILDEDEANKSFAKFIEKNTNLPFEPNRFFGVDDIQIIVVDTEDDAYTLIDEIEQFMTFGDRSVTATDQTKKRLIPKIIPYDMIKKDVVGH